jgi:hypothetical protein
MMALTKPVDGQVCGCADTDQPQKYSMKQLSRLYDMLYAAQEAGINVMKLTPQVPTAMMIEFNYSKWRYVTE